MYRRWIYPILFLLAGAGWCLLVYLKPPAEWGTPGCPSQWLTGLYCPGCGSTRATHCLLHGDWRGSLRYNPMLLPMLPVMAWLFVRFFYEQLTRKTFPWRLPGGRFFHISVLILLLTYGILRNIPLECLSRLRPP